jgi:predicted regulator of Ras-like GTPase activity (Roadblock/LC7/MglB family)
MDSGLVIYDEQLTKINELISRLLKESDAKCALLVNRDGRTVAKQGFTRTMDTDQLGALVAGSFSATSRVAALLGEPEFTVMFHQGKHDHIHIALVDEKTLLVVTFDERTTVGMVRLVAKAVGENLAGVLLEVYQNPATDEELGSADEIAEGFDDILGASE